MILEVTTVHGGVSLFLGTTHLFNHSNTYMRDSSVYYLNCAHSLHSVDTLFTIKHISLVVKLNISVLGLTFMNLRLDKKCTYCHFKTSHGIRYPIRISDFHILLTLMAIGVQLFI